MSKDLMVNIISGGPRGGAQRARPLPPGANQTPLMFNQTGTRRAVKKFFRPAPLLSQGLYERPPPLSDGLDLRQIIVN